MSDGDRQHPDGVPALSAVPWEARPYQGRRAGVVSRVLACAVDFVVVVLALLALYAAWSALDLLVAPASFAWPRVSGGTVLTVGALVLGGYFAAGWATTGRTFGAHLLGLRVVGGRGQRLGPTRSLVRALFCVLFPLGLFWSAVSRNNRSVQDMVLRTSVRYDWAEQPSPGGPGTAGRPGSVRHAPRRRPEAEAAEGRFTG